jgi:ribonucleoside-diphosphate reductase alpha chain
MNLEYYDEWKDTNAVQLAIRFLDAVMSEFIEKSESHHYLKAAHKFAKRHRALGLGVLGMWTYFQKHMIDPESIDAKQHTSMIFAKMKKEALISSKQLAEEFGEPELLKGYGLRNTTLLAIAPTTSSSSILGQASPGIEPYKSNYFKAGLAKGNFMRRNKFLKELLIEKGHDNEDIWRSILAQNGSVQHLDIFSQHEKNVFKTFKELSQLTLIQLASIRQRFVDQGQSLNLNIPPSMTTQDVNKLIITAWELGIKSLYYQRSESVSKEFLANMAECTSCEG